MIWKDKLLYNKSKQLIQKMGGAQSMYHHRRYITSLRLEELKSKMNALNLNVIALRVAMKTAEDIQEKDVEISQDVEINEILDEGKELLTAIRNGKCRTRRQLDKELSRLKDATKKPVTVQNRENKRIDKRSNKIVTGRPSRRNSSAKHR